MLRLHPAHTPFRPGIRRAGAVLRPVSLKSGEGSNNGDWLKQMQWGPIEQILRKSRYDEQTIARVYEADVYPPIYDFEGWRNHRSRGRYIENIVTLTRSYLLRDLSGPLTDVAVISLMVGIYETLLEGGSLPGNFPDIAMSAPEPFHQTSFALSLMLVFRTNSSYARWAEARAAWGSIVNISRDLCRQAVATFPESNSDLRMALCRWTVAFSRTCKLHLREDGSLKVAMQTVLNPSEFKILEEAKHRPLKTLQMLSEIVMAADVDQMVKLRMDANLTTLENQLGICERIFKTPIPLSYTRHTARFLFVWLCFLPFTLWTKMSWGIIPGTLLIAFFLLGIDEIAIQLEEPFGILPLENLCDTISRNVYEILEKKKDVKDIVAMYKDNSGAGRAPEGWAPPPRTVVPVSGTASEDEEAAEVVADAYMRVVFSSDDVVSHTVRVSDDDLLHSERFAHTPLSSSVDTEALVMAAALDLPESIFTVKGDEAPPLSAIKPSNRTPIPAHAAAGGHHRFHLAHEAAGLSGSVDPGDFLDRTRSVDEQMN